MEGLKLRVLEKETMPDKNTYELVKKTETTRATTIEIVLLVGLIGLLIGIFSNAVFSILWEFKLPNLSQTIIMVSILLFIVSLVWKALDVLYFQHIGEEKSIQIILPFLVAIDYLLIREIKSYDVTRAANEITKMVFRREEYKQERQKIKEDFDNNPNPFQQGLVKDVTMSLVQYLCLYYLGRAGEDSLGFSAPYHDGGYFPNLNQKKEKASLDNSLKNNYFIEKGYGIKDRFLLPFCNSPKLFLSDSAAKSGCSNIVFGSKYGDIVFEVSPYISNARGKKTQRVVERRITGEEGIGTERTFDYLIEINVKIKAKLKGRWIFKKEFRELADWIVYLFDYTEKHMDWEKYLEGETHRTLIDVDRKLDKLLEKKSPS